jgi:hypothetical protein
MEGGIDSSHVSFLHRGDLGTDPLFKGAKGNEYNLADTRPHFEVVESEGGLYIGARRNAENGNYYWRITPWVMPTFTQIPPRGDHPMHGHFWIPMDDENCCVWTYDFHPVRPLARREVDALRDGAGVHCKYEPGTFRPIAAPRRRPARPTAGCTASRARTRLCRRAWVRSATARRRTWSPPTTASSWRGIA